MKLYDEQGRLVVRTNGNAVGVETFLALIDTPANYAGQGRKVVRVNLAAGALEFDRRVDLVIDTDGSMQEHVVEVSAKVRAHRSGVDQTIGTGAWTKIQLNTENWDPGGNFDNLVNYRFVAPVAGYYFISGATYWRANAQVNHSVLVGIYKNGVIATQVRAHRAFDQTISTFDSDIIYLAATNFIELWGYQDSGVNCDIAAGTTLTFMAIHFLSK